MIAFLTGSRLSLLSPLSRLNQSIINQSSSVKNDAMRQKNLIIRLIMRKRTAQASNGGGGE
jgi:hypothetical protein